MKLELKHLVPYGPDLKVLWQGVVCQIEGYDFNQNSVILERVNVKLTDIKPILKPLEDYKNIEEVTDEFSEWSEERFIETFFLDMGRPLNCFDFIDYSVALVIFKYKLDLFDLFKHNLAITEEDIPKLNLL